MAHSGLCSEENSITSQWFKTWITNNNDYRVENVNEGGCKVYLARGYSEVLSTMSGY